jgi:prophage antirepressor-like protein
MNIQIISNPLLGNFRVATTDNGEHLLCLCDIIKALGYSPNTQILNKKYRAPFHLIKAPTSNGVRELRFGMASDVEHFLAQTDKQNTGIIKRWISMGMPANIEQENDHSVSSQSVDARSIEDIIRDPDWAIQLLVALKQERQQNAEARKMERQERENAIRQIKALIETL